MFVWRWNKINEKFLKENEFVCYLVGMRKNKTFKCDQDIFHLNPRRTSLQTGEKKKKDENACFV